MTNSSPEKRRILFVEDHQDSWDLLKFNLIDYKIIIARNFAEGLSLARQRYFDLYILDNWLPDGNGVELCRRIREFDPNTPILFYSAAGYARDVQEALRAGAQAYLVKPVRFDEIRQAVAQLVSVVRETVATARRAEIAAIREELAIRQMENGRRLEEAERKYLRAQEKVMRLKAHQAFLAAGGARGDFARWWPSVYLEEVRLALLADECNVT